MSWFRRPLPDEKYVYDGYGLARLAERGITKAEVESVISDPLTIEADERDSSAAVLTRTVAGRRIAVVMAPEGAYWLVVTAWVVD
jgi:hypothetical protein